MNEAKKGDRSVTIPAVTEEYCRPFVDRIPQDVVARKRKLYNEIVRIEKTNPYVASILRNQLRVNKKYLEADSQGDDNGLYWTIFSGVVVYQILESVLPVMPTVTKDICLTLATEHERDLQDKETVDLLLTQLNNELVQENLGIIQTIYAISNRCYLPRAKTMAFYGGATVYKLIKAKLEADALEEKWFPEEKEKPR